MSISKHQHLSRVANHKNQERRVRAEKIKVNRVNLKAESKHLIKAEANHPKKWLKVKSKQKHKTHPILRKKHLKQKWEVKEIVNDLMLES